MKYDKYNLHKKLKEVRLNRKDLYICNPDIYNKYCFCLTQEDFANILKVDRRTIMNWEKGISMPTLENLLTMCDLLDCTINYFLGVDELPYIDSIAHASHFTNIDPRIIDKAIECDDYLDYINFFMLPDNCLELCNKTTLIGWKKFWINENLSSIQSPLIDLIQLAFDEFFSFNSFEELSPNNFKIFLMKYLPIETLNFNSNSKNKSVINIKHSLSSKYDDFISKCSSDDIYIDFIDYIVELTYESLSNKIFIDLQKKKISDRYIELLTKYLSTI